MVAKVHGGIENGVSFSKDVAFVTVASATILAADANGSQYTEASILLGDAALLVANPLPAAIEVLQQISTVVGIHVVDSTISIIADYAQGYKDLEVGGAQQLALEAALVAAGLALATITVGTGFEAV